MDERQRAAWNAAPAVDLVGRGIDRCDGGDPVVIPEIPWRYEDTHNGPGWIRIKDTSGKQLKPLIRCKCGTVTGIGLHHVHADGRVTASFFDAEATAWQANGKTYTKEPGCGWHVFIKLAGYDLGEFPPDP